MVCSPECALPGPGHPNNDDMSVEKPNGQALGWNLLSSRYLFTSIWRRLREDHIRINGRGELHYTYLEIPPAVYVVPVTTDGRIVLIRQYRYPIDDWCLEIPAGGLHDQSGAPLAEVVRTELRQEIGAECREIEYITNVYASKTHSDEHSHLLIAWDVRLELAQALEQTEFIEIHPVPAETALNLARSGGVKDAVSALALLTSEPFLQARGLIENTSSTPNSFPGTQER